MSNFRVNGADKPNVHIIPWFLIKDTVTQGGSGRQDMEISFSIDTGGLTRAYFGRSVLPEDMEEYEDMTDLQREAANPYARDFLICRRCEDSLSRLETIFASEFNVTRIDAGRGGVVPCEQHSLITPVRYSENLFQLFVKSIFYRCSLARFNGFSLDDQVHSRIEENLRTVFLTNGLKKAKPNTVVPVKTHFLLMAGMTARDGDPTKQFIVVNKSQSPYFIYAGRWFFELFRSEKQMKACNQYLYGIIQCLPVSQYYDNVKDKTHLFFLNATASVAVNARILDYFVERKLIGGRKGIRQLHLALFKQKAPEHIVNFILSKYQHYIGGETEFNALVMAFHDLKQLG